MVTGVVLSHSGPGDLPPALTPVRLLTAWTFEPWLALGVLVAAGLYAWGAYRLRSRGDRWPWARILSFFLGGLGTFVVATMSALGSYDTTLLSVHMVQHIVLSMLTPIGLALGAPVTLALRILPSHGRSAGPRRWLLAVLHSRVARVLAFPPVAFVLFVASPWALYFTGWYDLTLENPAIHDLQHVHFVVVGSLFFWPLLGLDPVPGRVPYPFRMLIAFATLPFHAFLGVALMNMRTLIGGDWYTDLDRTWGASVVADQNLAGGILWGSGDLVGLVVLGVLFAQWVAASQREAAREDRRLDRLEAEAARTTARDAAGER